MNKNQTAALVSAAVARALIRAAGMTAENEQRKILGHSVAYNDGAFAALIDEECIGHNAVMHQLMSADDY